MKKCIGDKAIFAIEYDLFWVRPEHYRGYIWFWINNERIGAEKGDTYLSSCVRKFRMFLAHKIIRRFADSAEKSGAAMFDILFGGSIPEKNLGQIELYKLSMYNSIFGLIEVGGGNFRNKVKIALIDEPRQNRQRFIWKIFSEEIVKEFFIPEGYFEEVSRAFIKEVEGDVANWVGPT